MWKNKFCPGGLVFKLYSIYECEEQTIGGERIELEGLSLSPKF